MFLNKRSNEGMKNQKTKANKWLMASLAGGVKMVPMVMYVTSHYTHTHSQANLLAPTLMYATPPLCIHTDIHAHTHTYTHKYTHMHKHAHRCTHAHIYTHAYTHVHTLTNTHECTHAHTRVHMCTCTHIYTRTHTHTEVYHLEPKPVVIIICFTFTTVGSPNAEAYCWTSKFRILTGNAQPKSFGLCLLIFKFHNDILPASKILLLYEKLLTSLLLTLVKQLLERVQSPIKQVHGDK